MRQVIQQAQQTRGVSRTVLQATSSGFSLYEAMGYRTVTSFNVFISRLSPLAHARGSEAGVRVGTRRRTLRRSPVQQRAVP